jgi:Xaa-Pro aminopeptidase
MSRLADIQAALAEASLDGWLFYDFRLSDPIAYRILELPEHGIATRRWFCFIPRTDEPRKLVSAVEAHRLDAIPGSSIVYRSRDEMRAGLAKMLSGAKRVAMAYSPNCAIPYVARVDAGTIELVRSLGVEVISAADLFQRFEATLTEAQLKSHHRAAGKLRNVVNETFAEIARRIRDRSEVCEHHLQQFVMECFAEKGLTTASPPIVATNAHSADPHYGPSEQHPTAIRHGDFVLLDLWAKETGEESIYADFTWVAFVGESVPEEHGQIFSIVANARDAAAKLIHERVARKEAVSGRDADRAAREVIEAAGFGERFLHRTGHSIGREVHGTGANLDSLETDDHRMLIENTCFSIEPGIYLPGRFGVRSEIDMTIENGRAKISADAIQREIIPILARFAS